MTAPTVALSLKTGTMIETSDAMETDSVVRMAPAAIRAFYDLPGEGVRVPDPLSGPSGRLD